jgi:hypothetical protein
MEIKLLLEVDPVQKFWDQKNGGKERSNVKSLKLVQIKLQA